MVTVQMFPVAFATTVRSANQERNCANWKKMDNLKVKKYILFGGFSEDLSLEDSFKLSEGLLQRGKRNEDS